jgi:hypothetical protein
MFLGLDVCWIVMCTGPLFLLRRETKFAHVSFSCEFSLSATDSGKVIDSLLQVKVV